MGKTFISTLIFLVVTTLDVMAQDPFLQCEDTCSHIHGIDLSHYQGNVFWETIGDNTKMAYVYLKATEGGTRIDEMFERNIEMAQRYGLKVGSISIAQRWSKSCSCRISVLNVCLTSRILSL